MALHSEKGGVGKTAKSSGIAAVAADRGLKVAAVDLDPRATLTDELGIDEPELTVNDLLHVPGGTRPTDPADVVHDVLIPAGGHWPATVRVLPSARVLGNREADPTPGMEMRLKRALWGLRDDVDLILLDVPPRAGGKIPGAALIAANLVLIPATLTNDGFDGAQEALRSIEHYAVPGGLNPELQVAGIARSIVPRETEIRAVHEMWDAQIKEEFGSLVLEPQVRNYAVRETCRSACAPITSAPGREAKLLVEAYGQILDHVMRLGKGIG